MKYNSIFSILALMVMMCLLSIQVNATCDGSIKTAVNLTAVLLDGTEILTIAGTNGDFYALDIVITDETEYLLVTATDSFLKYSLNGTFINSAYVNSPVAITHSNDRIFISDRFNIYVFDTNFNSLTSINNLFLAVDIHYDLTSEKLYLIQNFPKSFLSYNNNLNQVDNVNMESNLIDGSNLKVIYAYNNLVYVGSAFRIYIYQDNVFENSYLVCTGSTIYDIHVDKNREYLLVTCYSSKQIELYKIDGTTLTYVATKQLNVNPVSLSTDSKGRIVFTHDNTNGLTILG